MLVPVIELMASLTATAALMIASAMTSVLSAETRSTRAAPGPVTGAG
jgi:hypothetical protein